MISRRSAILGFAKFIIFSPLVFAAKKTSKKGVDKQQANRPEELRGSKQQRVEQNVKAENLGIGQILTGKELLIMAKDGRLVELKSRDYYVVDRGTVPVRKMRSGKKVVACPLRENRVFVRAEARAYLETLTKDFVAFTKFRKRPKVTSGARSLEEQVLMRTKGSCYYTPYAAKVLNGSLEESLHIRGIAVDISRRVVTLDKGKLKEVPMSRKEIDWMRNRLIADKLKGVEFEIENQEEPVELETEPIEEKICYHIVVFPK